MVVSPSGSGKSTLTNGVQNGVRCSLIKRSLIKRSLIKRSMQAATPCPETGHGAVNHNHLPVHPWSEIVILRAIDQTACRLSAEDLPVL
jgi:hypothetical protein